MLCVGVGKKINFACQTGLKECNMSSKLLRWGKGILNLINKKTFKPYMKKKNIEGVKFDFWICDSDGRDWYDTYCTDPDWMEMRFIKEKMLVKGDVVFECGGHHGCTAILLSYWVGSEGKVLTFEPNPANCDIIEKNISQNSIKNIILERKAVGAEHGIVKINDSSNASINTSGKGIEVELVFLDEYKRLDPTFIKIDVEGFEGHVLKGAKSILLNRPKIAMEVHTDQLEYYGSSISDLLELLNIENYKIWIQWEDGHDPVEYDMKTPITKRVHLFALPKHVGREL